MSVFFCSDLLALLWVWFQVVLDNWYVRITEVQIRITDFLLCVYVFVCIYIYIYIYTIEKPALQAVVGCSHMFF